MDDTFLVKESRERFMRTLLLALHAAHDRKPLDSYLEQCEIALDKYIDMKILASNGDGDE